MAKWRSPFRTIKFWVLYDPVKREIIESAKHKYLLPVPSRDSGRVIIECKGVYVAPKKGNI